jgi:hypothetical protein
MAPEAPPVTFHNGRATTSCLLNCTAADHNALAALESLSRA